MAEEVSRDEQIEDAENVLNKDLGQKEDQPFKPIGRSFKAGRVNVNISLGEDPRPPFPSNLFELTKEEFDEKPKWYQNIHVVLIVSLLMSACALIGTILNMFI